MTDGSLGQSCDKHHSLNQRPKSNRDHKHCDRTHASRGDWITFYPDDWLWRGESRLHAGNRHASHVSLEASGGNAMSKGEKTDLNP